MIRFILIAVLALFIHGVSPTFAQTTSLTISFTVVEPTHKQFLDPGGNFILLNDLKEIVLSLTPLDSAGNLVGAVTTVPFPATALSGGGEIQGTVPLSDLPLAVTQVEVWANAVNTQVQRLK